MNGRSAIEKLADDPIVRDSLAKIERLTAPPSYPAVRDGKIINFEQETPENLRAAVVRIENKLDDLINLVRGRDAIHGPAAPGIKILDDEKAALLEADPRFKGKLPMLMLKTRAPRVSRLRFKAMRLLRNSGYHAEDIATFFGLKRSAVLHGLREETGK
jgi:hypothetical protein